MNNEFLTLITFLKDLFVSISEVQTITHGVVNDIDLDKKNIYPLVHIQALTADYQTAGTLTVNFEIHVLTIRDTNKIPSTDKWQRNDNELQNYNDCLTIASKVQAYFERYRDLDNDNNIELVEDISPEFVSLQFLNMLDGVKLNLKLSINDNVSGCW